MISQYQKKERLITVDKVNLSYGEKVILRDVDISIDNITRPGMAQGQVVALLGPSGAGKTQLFRCMAGLQVPTSGSVKWVDRDVRAGDVGVVQQSYPLLNHRTIWSNLMIATHGRIENKEKAESLLAHFGLSNKKNSYPLELSGGQRQRIAIIQQLLCSSHFLLMDEPFSGLDVMAKERVYTTIRDVSTTDELNTVLFTTHDIESAVSLADTVLILGKEKDKEGGTIVHKIDLAAIGIAWADNIQHHRLFAQTVLEIKEFFKTL